MPATVLHNAPGRYRPITSAIADLLDGARESLDVVNPYVTDARMIRRIADAARRGVRVRLFVPATANNWACAAAQHHHHGDLLEAGVRILEYPTMLHAKAFVRDGEVVLAGTCNLEAWSLKRFFEIDVHMRSPALARQFDERFSAPAEVVSRPGHALVGTRKTSESASVCNHLAASLTASGHRHVTPEGSPHPLRGRDRLCLCVRRARARLMPPSHRSGRFGGMRLTRIRMTAVDAKYV